MKKIYLDTETTGLAPGQIAQLSMIIQEDNQKIRALNYFFTIDYITAEAEQVCGRGIEFYREASKGLRFKDYHKEILEELKGSTLIAHNIKFDENFISTEFWRLGIMFTPAGKFDTMDHFRYIVNALGKTGRVKNPKLDEVIKYYGLDKNKIQIYANQLFNIDNTKENIGLHDARFDTTAMFVAFQVYNDSILGKGDWKGVFV